jgi:hypothetical protein
MENNAPSGFQHLLQPQTWLCAVWLDTLTLTGLSLHLQTSVPPLKPLAAFQSPLATEGCMEIALLIVVAPGYVLRMWFFSSA